MKTPEPFLRRGGAVVVVVVRSSDSVASAMQENTDDGIIKLIETSFKMEALDANTLSCSFAMANVPIFGTDGGAGGGIC